MIQVILDGNRKLYNLTDEQRVKIKDDLLVGNPAYFSAMKYSGYNRVNIPKYLQYFEDKKDYLEVPIGYKLNYEHEVVEDLRKEVTVEYPPIDIELRVVQDEALEAYLENPERGMICMSTGAGKSIWGIYVASLLRQKTLVIVHKNDLVTGWQKDIKKAFKGKVIPGLVKAQSDVIGEQITIATVQTLSRKSEEELEKYTREFGMIITDEMHKIGASIYDIIPKFSSAYKIGLSATPERSDGLEKVMTYYLGEFAYVSTDEHEEGIILPVEVIVKNSNAYYIPNVIYQSGRYVLATKKDKSGLKSIESIPYKKRPKIPYFTIDMITINNKKYQETFLSDLLREFNEGKSLVVFLSQKESCRIVESLLIDKGVPKDKIQLYYGDAEESTKDMMKRAEENRNLITIATYSIATEGTNVKQWEVAFLLSSINNGKNTEQAIGRIRRIADNKSDIARVYDYRFPLVYSFSRHGYTRDERYRKLKFKRVKK